MKTVVGHFVSLLAALGLGLLLPQQAVGQARGPSASLRVVVDGRPGPWPLDARPEADSIGSAVPALIGFLQEQGRLDARLDSIQTGPDGSATVWMDGGPRYVVESLSLGDFAWTAPRSGLRSNPGAPFVPHRFEEDVQEILRHLERQGYVAAEVEVRRLAPRTEGDVVYLDIGLEIHPGPQPDLVEIRLPGGTRTRPAYVASLADLRPGKPVRKFDGDEIRMRLVKTGDFIRVGEPSLFVETDGGAVLVVPIEEAPPGAFDAVLGYLPPSGDGRGSVVGNVDVSLRHLMGAGRQFRFQFNRMPARVSRLLVEGEDPFVAGTPFRLGAGFEGYQKDSTYARQRFRAEAGYRLPGDVEATVSISREATRPGTDSLIGIPRSNSWFAGVGFRISRVDDPRRPSKGWQLSLRAERGTKVRSAVAGEAGGNAPAEGEGLRQQRLFAAWRHFIPVVGRHLAVWGGETSVILSPVYDAADLFQLGGANSLRGYNEEQFDGYVVGRGLLEWRFRLEDDSYLFAFGDLGLLGRRADEPDPPADGPGGDPPWRLYPGYGVGMQFGTAAGQFAVSFALNPSEGLATKVHVGISLGL